MRGKTFNRRLAACPHPMVAKAVLNNINYRQGSRFFKTPAEFQHWLASVAKKEGFAPRDFAIGVSVLIDEGWLRFTKTREGSRLNLAAPAEATGGDLSA